MFAKQSFGKPVPKPELGGEKRRTGHRSSLLSESAHSGRLTYLLKCGYNHLSTMSFKCPTWNEATASGLWLAGAASLVWFGPQLGLMEQVILWVILLAGFLILRRFWSWLLGPLFFYDVVRTARRNRLIPVRCLYAVAL